jgi:hypothetical protein
VHRLLARKRRRREAVAGLRLYYYYWVECRHNPPHYDYSTIAPSHHRTTAPPHHRTIVHVHDRAGEREHNGEIAEPRTVLLARSRASDRSDFNGIQKSLASAEAH